MKRYSLIAASLALALTSTPALGQRHKAELTAFAGWQFGSSVNVFNGKLSIESDWNYGGILDFIVRRGGAVELYYGRQPTNLKITPTVGVVESVPMTVQYFQIGGLGYMEQGITQPFAKFTLGATYYKPDAQTLGGINISDEWRFSVGLGLGVKAFPSERVGVRLEGNLFGTFLDTNSGLWCGFGGCSLGFFGAGMLQANINGGVTLAI